MILNLNSVIIMILIDEIASGNMRVYKDGKIVEPVDLTNFILEK